ncbi:hypothetical protein NQ317_014287 [Molorchus minor]|uniref:Uncharacterized protein n=1 Tax=Molorchus minor TaxID=1323400 RepID=A0ABQ9IUY2_9CUCU|nr:hypothetical protein NQ317_014287 [Molorchus minor]
MLVFILNNIKTLLLSYSLEMSNLKVTFGLEFESEVWFGGRCHGSHKAGLLTSDIDDFDPLKSNSSPLRSNLNSQAPLSITNPLYTYENHNIKQNGAYLVCNVNHTGNDLLQEYGLNFNFSNMPNQQTFDSFNTNKSEFTRTVDKI